MCYRHEVSRGLTTRVPRVYEPLRLLIPKAEREHPMWMKVQSDSHRKVGQIA